MDLTLLTLPALGACGGLGAAGPPDVASAPGPTVQERPCHAAGWTREARPSSGLQLDGVRDDARAGLEVLQQLRNQPDRAS